MLNPGTRLEPPQTSTIPTNQFDHDFFKRMGKLGAKKRLANQKRKQKMEQAKNGINKTARQNGAKPNGTDKTERKS